MAMLRIGVTASVNTQLLIRGLEKGIATDYELIYSNPSSLADQLRYGELDSALIPSIEFLRGVGDGYVPGLCISSRGPAESARLLANKPLDQIERILVDRSSRSSVAMLRLLLDQVHHVNPDFHIFRPDPASPLMGPDGQEAEASMVIGDLAMALSEWAAQTVIDLDEWWQDTFHFPFVQALWVYNTISGDEKRGERLMELLEESARIGRDELPLICEEVATAKGWDEMRVHEHLNRRIGYELDHATLDGLRTFRRLCIDNYLAPNKASVASLLESRESTTRALSGNTV